MLHRPPADDRESYTVVEEKVGNTTITSYFTVNHRTKREETDRELDDQFAPTVLGSEMITDATQWLSVSVTSFRTLKYLWLILGGTYTLTIGAVLFIPVIGLLCYQFLRHKDDDAAKVLVFYRLALLLLGGLL